MLQIKITKLMMNVHKFVDRKKIEIKMKRSRTIKYFFEATSSQPTSNNTNTNESPIESARVDLNPDDINPDPGLRKPIEELHVDVRDAARREYLAMGPCRPKGHV